MKFSLPNWLISKIGKWLMHESKPRHAYLCDFEKIRYELRCGDVVLVEGRHRVSHIIKQITNSAWTHAGLYIGRLHDIDNPDMRNLVQRFYSGPPDSQLVIESQLGKGTTVVPLTYYKEDHIRICRPNGLSREDAQAIINYAIKRLGREYNIRHVFDLMRFVLPWGVLPRRWRSSLFARHASRATRDICSSMIAEAFKSVNFPLLPIIRKDTKKGMELIHMNPRLFTPKDFDYSPYFSIIKYPFISISGQYHDLPWRKDATGDGRGYIMNSEDDSLRKLEELEESALIKSVKPDENESEAKPAETKPTTDKDKKKFFNVSRFKHKDKAEE